MELTNQGAKEQIPKFNNCVFYGDKIGFKAGTFGPGVDPDRIQAVFVNCVFCSRPAPWWVKVWEGVKKGIAWAW